MNLGCSCSVTVPSIAGKGKPAAQLPNSLSRPPKVRHTRGCRGGLVHRPSPHATILDAAFTLMRAHGLGYPFSLVGFRVLFGRCCGCCGANSSRIDKHQRSSIIRADLATTKQCAPSKAEFLRYFAYSAHLRLELAHRSVAYPPAGPHSHADRFGWETRAETPLTPHNLPPDICKHRGF